MKLVSEWDPILTDRMTEYCLVRLNDHNLEFKNLSGVTVTFDSKIIPQLRAILKRLDENECIPGFEENSPEAFFERCHTIAQQLDKDRTSDVLPFVVLESMKL